MTREPSRGYALSTGIEIDPCDSQYRENPGTFLRHKVDEALQQCDRVLAVAPHDVDALLRKAALYLGPYLHEGFLDRLQGRVWVSRNKAGELIRQPDVDVTQRFIATFWISATTERLFGLFTVPDVDPQCGESLYWIDTPSRCVDVLALLDTLLDAEPSNLKALWWRGFLLFRSGHREDALDCYDRMLQVDADDERTWLAKAACLEKLQRFNEAIECYDRMGSEVLTRKAKALAAVGRLEEAMQCYDQLIEEEGCWGDSSFMKGYILTRWGEYEEALEYVNVACKGLVVFEALFFRPYLLFKTGDTLGAYCELAELKRNYPNHFVKRATDLKDVVCGVDYRRLVERIDADTAPAAPP